MPESSVKRDPASGRAIPFGEFVTLAAALMALGAIGVDMMLPALPAIARRLGAATANEQQLVISVYLAGLGAGQLIHGPLSDRFGRRPVMAAALAVYCIGNLVAALSASFALLLVVRMLAGIAVAATRVVTVAIVRDRYVGRPMARVMSLVGLVFMIAPVLAPTLGQGVLLIGSWRLIFGVIAGCAAIVLVWFLRRMDETLHAWDRLPLSRARLLASWRTTLTDRCSIGYTLATALLQGGLFGYVTSVQQIVTTVFARPALLNLVFGATAGTMAAANLLNSRFVLRFGSRAISHGALVVLVIVAGASLTINRAGGETLVPFVVLQALTMGCFALTGANFSAMAMENMGAIAGTASSVQGFIAITGGALIGTAIGQSFAGTTVPLHLGSLLAALGALAIVAVTERGRLFRPR